MALFQDQMRNYGCMLLRASGRYLFRMNEFECGNGNDLQDYDLKDVIAITTRGTDCFFAFKGVLHPNLN